MSVTLSPSLRSGQAPRGGERSGLPEKLAVSNGSATFAEFTLSGAKGSG
jgi:hypothetical protein